MANPTTTVIHQVSGLAFANVDGTTTTVVKGIITQAQADIKSITGTTTGATQDRAIRDLAAAYTTQNAMANMDPNSGNQVMFKKPASGNHIQLDISQLADGIYWFRLESAKEIWGSGKLIKL